MTGNVTGRLTLMLYRYNVTYIGSPSIFITIIDAISHSYWNRYKNVREEIIMSSITRFYPAKAAWDRPPARHKIHQAYINANNKSFTLKQKDKCRD